MQGDDLLAETRHIEHQLIRIDDTALLMIDDDDIAYVLRTQRSDHEHHAAEIEQLLREQAVAMPPMSEEFRRHEAGHLEAITTAADDLEVLRRVLDAELDCAQRYEIAQRAGVAEEASALVDQHLQAERRHVRELERYVAVAPLRGQGHGGGAYNDTGGPMGTGPGTGGRRRE